MNITRVVTVTALMIACSGLFSKGFCYAPEPELLKVKGYCPDIIKTAETQRNRQEWRQAPPPRLSPVENFFHNIFYNNWTGNVDEFGNYIIRDR